MEYWGEPLDTSRFRRMYITCTALPAVMLMLTFVLWFMKNGAGEAEVASLPLLQHVIFAVLAFASLPIALLLRRITLKQTGDFTGQTSRWSPVQTFTGSEAAVMRITQAAIVGMAMPEISVLLGFVEGFTTMSWLYYIPFALYTLIGWTIMYPRPSQVREWYARQIGGSALPPMNVSGV